MAKTWSAIYTLNRREKITYNVLYAFVYLLSLLPFCVLHALSDMLYMVMYRCVGYRTKVVRKNLRAAFPEKSETELKDIEKEFYHYLCDYIFETVKMTSISKEQMHRHIVFNGMEKVNDIVNQGKGIAFYLGHYCNWEWITAIGMDFPKNGHGCQIYHVIESKVFDQLMLKIRSRWETENIPRFEALKRIITLNREKRCPLIGFISDQSPETSSVPHWITFLNQDTPFITGTERIAKKLSMPVGYLDVHRVKRSYYSVDIVILAEDTHDIPDWKITEMYAKAMETSIRRQPAYWLWSHNRWKHTHDSFCWNKSSTKFDEYIQKIQHINKNV